MQLLDRQAVLRLMALSAGAVPRPAASADDISSIVRRAVVRGAQIADQVDSVWQQVAGEVVPAWQQPTSQTIAPPPLIERDFASVMLDLPLDVAASCAGTTSASLFAAVPGARQDAVLLYSPDGVSAPAPLQNEPLYGALSKAGAPPPGAAVRGFAPSLLADASAGDYSNSTLFGFEAYARCDECHGRHSAGSDGDSRVS